MPIKRFLMIVAVGLSGVLLYQGCGVSRSDISGTAALTGQVSSAEEGPMEGVLVTARRDGSTVRVTVATDQQGRYSFPRERLQPGRYSLRIRAVGYEAVGYRLSDPGEVKITAQTTRLDLNLRKVEDLSTQLSNGEWLLSMPGTDEQKAFLTECTGCHTLERVVRSRYSADEWVGVLEQMGDDFIPGRPRAQPAQRDGAPREGQENMGFLAANPEQLRKRAEYLSSVNLSSVATWKYPLKTLPRPRGRATRVIITEYDLPRPETQPHDVNMDSTGTVWYADFQQQYMGRLDPKTAKVIEYGVPTPKPDNRLGINDVELDKDENVWLGTMRQGSFVKFDRKTEKFQLWRLPKEVDNDRAQLAMVNPRKSHVDGKVWSNNVGRRGLQRLDIATGQIDTINPYRDLPKEEARPAGPWGRVHSVYGIAPDSHNNVYFMDYGGAKYIGRVDAKTLKVTLYPTPTADSVPHRGQMDSQDRLWFAETLGNNVAMFDTRTEKFQEWRIPTPWTSPYDVVADRNGEAWTGGMSTDGVLRLDPKSGQFTEYLLPTATNIRRVFVDNSTTPVTFWVGNNHGAAIIRLEPFD